MGFIVSIRPRKKRGLSNCELGVSPKDREQFFPKRGDGVYIQVQLPDETNCYEVRLRPSFWDNCSHFGSKEILKWIRENKYYDYPPHNPPKFRMKKHDDGKFQILGLVGK